MCHAVNYFVLMKEEHGNISVNYLPHVGTNYSQYC